MLILQLMALLCLGFIFYQDMRYRAVYWLCFPFLCFLFLAIKQQQGILAELLAQVFYNLLFLSSQLLLLWVYLSIKNRRAVYMTQQYLGWGDILFLITLSLYLSPANYVLFYVGSLMVIISFLLVQRKIQTKTNPEIPLAGMQAMLLLLLISYSMVQPSFKPYADEWLLAQLSS